MSSKAAAMTPTEIRKSGYVIEQYVPIGAGEISRANPWVLRRIGTQEGMQRFASRDDAIDELLAQLRLDGDGKPTKSRTNFNIDDTMEIDRVVYGGPGDQ